LGGTKARNSPHPSTKQDSDAPSLDESETVKAISDKIRRRKCTKDSLKLVILSSIHIKTQTMLQPSHVEHPQTVTLNMFNYCKIRY
jgi:hypothetical protein